ncbi:MAG: manganese efflux pump [Clostridia bacterium]|nr:manganese efflux pump [Clostridia bacterium]
MDFFELFLLAVGVSMDAFAVSICKGLSLERVKLKNVLSCGLWFGGFQALMPLLGFFIGGMFAEYIVTVDHWVAFVLLAFIGGNMLKESFSKEEESISEKDKDFSFKTMFLMAVATSIDALAVGVSLAMAGGVNIFLSVALIGVITCITSGIGVKLGSVFGAKYKKKAELLGGVILIVLGLKILIEHLLVL